MGGLPSSFWMPVLQTQGQLQRSSVDLSENFAHTPPLRMLHHRLEIQMLRLKSSFEELVRDLCEAKFDLEQSRTTTLIK